MHSAHPTRRRPGGFTLIELLTVVAIIAVLAGILIPILGAVRRSADRATAVSALRQIGVALNLYAQDHRGYLPGTPDGRGLWLSHPALDTGDNAALLRHLGPYAGINRLGTSTVPVAHEVFVSRAHLRQFPDLKRSDGGKLNIYASNRGVRAPVASSGKEAFGYYTTPSKRPLTLLEVAGATRETSWLLQEGDNAGGASASWDGATFPASPVHENTRHRLYADGRVAALSLQDSRLN